MLPMKVGDLVKADNYLSYIGGQTGLVIKIQSTEHCRGVFVLFGSTGIKLISVENLKVVK